MSNQTPPDPPPGEPSTDMVDPGEGEVSTRFAPGLYIVATPIGNLADMTRRAEALLAAADIVACEDSRVTGKLLHHLGLKKRMKPYHGHSSAHDRDYLLGLAREGVVALVSDAGTPLISDPGYKLVRAARVAGVTVTTMPGPSAAIAALTLSGLPSDRFLFEGFLPSKAGQRDKALSALAAIPATLIFYESGPRLRAMLGAARAALGDRQAAVVREITKRFEEAVTGSLSELAERYDDTPPKGEIVVVIGPPGEEEPDELDRAELDALILAAIADKPMSKAAGEIAKAHGLDRKAVYARALELKGK